MKKIFTLLLVVAVVSAVFVVPAFAMGSKSVEAPQDSFTQIVKAFVQLLVALFAIGIGSERGTQLLKVFWNLLTEKLAPYLNLKDQRSFILAAAVAFFVTYYFHIDLTRFLSLFDGFDPALLKMVNSLLLFFASTQIHDKFS